MNIIPAILPENFEQVVDKLFRIEGLTKRVQIDVCDGVFGLERTWIPKGTEELPHGFQYEFDMMVVDWKNYIPKVIALGATRIVAHVDSFSDKDILSLLDCVEPERLMLGVAVSNTTSLEVHIDMIQKIYAQYPHVFIQVMGIRKIGAQGQVFDKEVVGRIRTLKKLFSYLSIQVDGSMNEDTVLKVEEAGADTVIVGSYIFGGARSIRKAIDTLKAITVPKRKLAGGRL
jgi:ribulose-phosphate 3-epimerase